MTRTGNDNDTASRSSDAGLVESLLYIVRSAAALEDLIAPNLFHDITLKGDCLRGYFSQSRPWLITYPIDWVTSCRRFHSNLASGLSSERKAFPGHTWYKLQGSDWRSEEIYECYGPCIGIDRFRRALMQSRRPE